MGTGYPGKHDNQKTPTLSTNLRCSVSDEGSADPRLAGLHYCEHMAGLMYVRDMKLLLKPVFEAVLTETELQTLVWRIEKVADYPNGIEIPDGALIASNEAWIRWEVLSETGGSGSLPLDNGTSTLTRFVQSDLQDFIAESHFGWGEFREPLDQP